ncbi:hypothetical protein ACFWA9_11250 [Kitasatospora sp. NPDC059973]|uniref:hypothetical protein n=1 Tax=Kitasatospora sp. NPDC059973 TaxID=3347020 RepID=UPI00368DB767
MVVSQERKRMVSMDQESARLAADAYCRERVRGWDERAYRLRIDETVAVEGAYAFGYLPTVPDARGRLRVGGNLPVIVDRETGACRFVAGVTEYFALRDAAKPQA